MSRTKRSRTRGTARKPAPRISSRRVTSPTAPTPTAPERGSPQPAPPRDHTFPHGPPRRPTRMRISGTNPWSVTVMSFFFLTGLGVCVLGAALATSVLLDIVAPGEWPTPWETLIIATGVVALEILLGTVLACLCGFMYNYTARFSGGVEVSLTGDLTDPPPAAQALRLLTRLPTRLRRPEADPRPRQP
ncbi:MAG: DUF3566 domain-containing protein [Streptomyces sp.]|jgi:Transmembrane domain of unknown function (DUF3566)|uniref:DUF3566 domain-containing protein n=1 Tax=Streptomyces sp. TaxID=1931 RepID=UPI0025FDC3EC|nr:DUF3566 domain-containing protein [Streptomyces sp.]MBW8800208.1 DUF3566 domain-containing protein [Streptomyces sp.]